MKRSIFQMRVLRDGYVEGPNKETDWHAVDSDFNEFAVDVLNSADWLLFGHGAAQLPTGEETMPRLFT